MRDLAALEIRRLKNALEGVERRIALMSLPGKVAEKDADKRMLRLKLGETDDGQPILGPWSRWQEATAGGMKIHSEPADNEQMILSSASGTVGAASMTMPATYDQDNEAPSKSSDTAVFTCGQGRIEIGAAGILLQGPVKIEGDVDLAGAFDVEGSSFTHNGKNVGGDHGHVTAPPGPSGPPV